MTAEREDVRQITTDATVEEQYLAADYEVGDGQAASLTSSAASGSTRLTSPARMLGQTSVLKRRIESI